MNKIDHKHQGSPVLEVFFEDPDARFHIREIARRTGLHPNTVSRDVRKLVKDGVLKVSPTRAIVEVSADRESSLFVTLKRLRNLKEILLSGIVDEIDRSYASPRAIVLFGSYSRGEDVRRSDVDIAVISNQKHHPDLSKFEKLFGRPIQILEVDLSKAGKGLITNLANGVVLRGYLDV